MCCCAMCRRGRAMSDTPQTVRTSIDAPAHAGAPAAGARFSLAAALIGPVWAARHALWITFFWIALIELVGLVRIATGLWPVAAEDGQSFAGHVIGGIAIVLLARLALGLA